MFPRPHLPGPYRLQGLAASAKITQPITVIIFVTFFDLDQGGYNALMFSQGQLVGKHRDLDITCNVHF